jgi:hypothetical protein
LWELLDKPVGSTAEVIDSDTASPYFIPDLYGSYRLRCTTNGGGPNNISTLICAVLYDAAGAPFNSLRFLPAFGENEGEDNFEGQTRGYSATFEALERDTSVRLSRLESLEGGHIIQDPAGAEVTDEQYLQFVGDAVAVTDDSTNRRTVVTISGGGHTVEDSTGTPMTQRHGLEFDGPVDVTDDAVHDKTIVTIPADAAAIVASMRTIGTGSLQACAGDDGRLSDARAPTGHASTHNAGSGDALDIDSAAATGSLRTLGTSSTSACAGNDSRLSDARAPTGTAGGNLSGSYPDPVVAKLQSVDVDTTAPLTGKFLEYNGTHWTPNFLPSYRFTINSSPVSTVENVGTEMVAGACYFNLSKLAGITSTSKKIWFRAIASASSADRTTTVDLYDLNGITVGGIGQVSGSPLTTSAVVPTFLEVDLTGVLDGRGAGILEVRLSLAVAAVGYVGTLYTAYLEVEW